jgi:hypothetical protein
MRSFPSPNRYRDPPPNAAKGDPCQGRLELPHHPLGEPASVSSSRRRSREPLIRGSLRGTMVNRERTPNRPRPEAGQPRERIRERIRERTRLRARARARTRIRLRTRVRVRVRARLRPRVRTRVRLRVRGARGLCGYGARNLRWRCRGLAARAMATPTLHKRCV